MTSYSLEDHVRFMQALHKRASSSTLLLENSAGELLIVKANYKKHWTVPGGVIGERETPLHAAVRETYEEVGVQINPADVEFVAVINRSGPVFDTYQFVFKAALPENATIHLQSDEIDDYTFVTKAQLAKNDRYYGEVIFHWANERTGYIEQEFESQLE